MLPLALSLACLMIGQAYADCSIKLEAISGKYPPLLLQNKEFVYPTSEQENGDRFLRFGDGDTLELYCHGSVKYQATTYISTEGLPKTSSLPVTCTDGRFLSGDIQVDVEKVSCNRRQEPRLVKTKEVCSPIGADGRTTNLDGKLFTVQIGWNVSTNFIEQIRMCIDEKVYGTIWTNHVVSKNVEFRDIDSSRPSFRIDNTYIKRFFTWGTNTKLNTVYKKTTQKATIVGLLGSNMINNNELIETSTSGTNYFAKGHLSPDAAFVYNVQQDATYYFMNVAPQFQSFNNGNWKALEGSVRDLSFKLAKDITVYTGTHGVLTYADQSGNQVPIYLYTTSGNKYVPAPQYYWKVVYDPESGNSAAFIGLNDPHAQAVPKPLCNNVCSQMSWVDWSINELDSGYMYCCSVEEARKAIPSMPDIPSGGLIDLNGGSGGTGGNSGSCSTGPCECNCVPAGESYSCSCTCNGQSAETTVN